MEGPGDGMMEGGEMMAEEMAPMMGYDMEMGRRSTQSAMMMEEARPKSEAAKMEWLYTRKKDVKTDKMQCEDDPEINDVRVAWI